MSRGSLGNKQTIILHNCLINHDKFDLVITPHRQSVGYIRTKRQTLRKKITNKQKQITRKRFSKPQYKELHNLNDSINKNHQIDNQLYFTDSETTSPASVKVKRKIKNFYTNKTIRLYNWDQSIRHIENYTLTVIQHKSDSK